MRAPAARPLRRARGVATVARRRGGARGRSTSAPTRRGRCSRSPSTTRRHPIPPEFVQICNLERLAPAEQDAVVRPGVRWQRPRSARSGSAVDPVLGRLTYPNGVSHARYPGRASPTASAATWAVVRTIGGRRSMAAQAAADAERGATREIDWQIGVSRDRRPGPGPDRTDHRRRRGCVERPAARHDRRHRGDGQRELRREPDRCDSRRSAFPHESRLLIVAASWPEVDDPLVPGGVRSRRRALCARTGCGRTCGATSRSRGRPAGGRPPTGGLLIVDGLLIEGKVTVDPWGPRRAGPGELHHRSRARAASPSTPAGRRPTLEQPPRTSRLRRSICGRVRLADTVPGLAVVDSIVDATKDRGNRRHHGARRGARHPDDAPSSGVSAAGRSMPATASFASASPSPAGRPVASASATCRWRRRPPRRYRCQPTDPASAHRVFPQFTSTDLGQPGYLQLAAQCPSAITEGAEDEGEMGAFHFLQAGRRVRNLAANLDQYLRFGMEAGIFLVT